MGVISNVMGMYCDGNDLFRRDPRNVMGMKKCDGNDLTVSDSNHSRRITLFPSQ